MSGLGPQAGSVRVLLVALCLVPAAASSRLPRDEAWIRVETANFTLLSNARQQRVLTLGRSLEELRAVLAALQGSGANTPLPTKIFVFKSDDSFEPYKPLRDGRPAAVSGYFQPGAHSNFVAIDGSPRRDPSEVVFHEYLHYFADHNFPDVPLWFNEGLAEFYSTFEIEGDEAILGRPKEEHVVWLRQNRLIPMSEFLAVDPGSEHYNEVRRKGVFYAQAWALVHYLLADEERRRQVGSYLDLVARGEDLDRAFALAFDGGYLELERSLEDYVGGPSFAYSRITLRFQAGAELAAVTTLDRADVLYELGDLLAHHPPEREREARRHLEAALARDPDHGLALAGLGGLEDRAGNLPAAIALYLRATELEPEHYLPWFLHGLALVRSVSERVDRNGRVEAEDRQQAAAARRSLLRSLELRGDFGPSHAALGTTYLYDDPPRAEGLPIMQEARRRLPGRADVTYHLVVLQARLGHTERAEQLLDRVLSRQDTEGGLLLAARYELARAQLGVAVELLERGEAEAALRLADAILDRCEQAAASGELVRQVAPMVEALHEAARRLGQIELYNRAVKLANEQRLDEALRSVQQLLHESPDPELRTAATELESQLRGLLDR